MWDLSIKKMTEIWVAQNFTAAGRGISKKNVV